MPEFKFHKIHTLDKANDYLKNHFIKEHNRLYAKNPNDFASAFVPLNAAANLDEILCEKHECNVTNDHIVESKTRNILLKILPSKNRLSYAKAKVTVYKTTEGTLKVKYKNQNLNFTNLNPTT